MIRDTYTTISNNTNHSERLCILCLRDLRFLAPIIRNAFLGGTIGGTVGGLFSTVGQIANTIGNRRAFDTRSLEEEVLGTTLLWACLIVFLQPYMGKSSRPSAFFKNSWSIFLLTLPLFYSRAVGRAALHRPNNELTDFAPINGIIIILFAIIILSISCTLIKNICCSKRRSDIDSERTPLLTRPDQQPQRETTRTANSSSFFVEQIDLRECTNIESLVFMANKYLPPQWQSDNSLKPFICPITLGIPKDPVRLKDDPTGTYFEKTALETWLSRSRTNPSTNNATDGEILTHSIIKIGDQNIETPLATVFLTQLTNVLFPKIREQLSQRRNVETYTSNLRRASV